MADTLTNLSSAAAAAAAGAQEDAEYAEDIDALVPDQMPEEMAAELLGKHCLYDLGPITMVGLDPGLKNIGYMLAVLYGYANQGPNGETPPKFEAPYGYTARIRICMAGSTYFLPPNVQVGTSQYIPLGKSFFNRILPSNDFLSNAMVVIEEPYYNPYTSAAPVRGAAGGSNAAMHNLGCCAIALQAATFILDGVPLLVPSRTSKELMWKELAEIPDAPIRPNKYHYETNKRAVVFWLRHKLEGLSVSGVGRKDHRLNINDHLADAALQLYYYAHTMEGVTKVVFEMADPVAEDDKVVVSAMIDKLKRPTFVPVH